jgi:hypothetical protein
MTEYQPVEASVTVPKGVGLDGFLKAVREILRYPRVTDVRINTRGVIWFKRHVRKDEQVVPVQIDFESVTPFAAVQASDVLEVALSEGGEPAPVAVARMFAALARDHVSPVAFVIGGSSPFAAWHKATSGIEIGEQAYGLPVMVDERIPSDVLVLCAAFGPGGSLVDVRRSYKLSLPLGSP